MKKKKCVGSLLVSKRGFTLIEVLLSLAVFTITVFVFEEWVYIFQRSASSVYKDEEIDNVMNKVTDAFGDSDLYCNYILSNIPANPNPNPNLQLTMAVPTGAPVSRVDFHDSNGLILANVLTVSSQVGTRKDLIISDIRLKPVSSIGNNEIVANLEFQFNRIGGQGSPTITRRIPILATVDPATHLVVSCTANFETTMSLQENLCEINSDGYAHYDQTSGSCVDNSNVTWFKGATPFVAACPSGYHVAVSPLNQDPDYLACSANGPGIVLPPRTYQSGIVDNSADTYGWIPSVDTQSQKCTFIYATVVNPSKYTSKVKCAQ